MFCFAEYWQHQYCTCACACVCVCVCMCVCACVCQYGRADSTSSPARADAAGRHQSGPRDAGRHAGFARQRRLPRNTQAVAALRRSPVRSFGRQLNFSIQISRADISTRNVQDHGCCLPAYGGHVLVTEFRGMALNGLFCSDVIRPHDLVPLLTLPTKSWQCRISSLFNPQKQKYQ